MHTKNINPMSAHDTTFATNEASESKIDEQSFILPCLLDLHSLFINGFDRFSEYTWNNSVIQSPNTDVKRYTYKIEDISFQFTFTPISVISANILIELNIILKQNRIFPIGLTFLTSGLITKIFMLSVSVMKASCIFLSFAPHLLGFGVSSSRVQTN